MTKLLYLASAYTGNERQQNLRQHITTYVAAALAEKGLVVYSPITHGHRLSEYLPPGIQSHEFWMMQCLPILERCDELWVLQSGGWRQSRGVQEEVAFAARLHIPTFYITATNITPEKEPHDEASTNF
jgi:nucleoside 2-deoxyribosyltransferase